MSEPKHTPGPWHVSDYLAADMSHRAACVRDAAGWSVAYLPGPVSGKADARRIVACVNACEGVDTDALPEIPGGVAGLLTVTQSLKQQRDELRAALIKLVDVFPEVVKQTPYGVPMPVSQIHDEARAALARCQ